MSRTSGGKAAAARCLHLLAKGENANHVPKQMVLSVLHIHAAYCGAAGWHPGRSGDGAALLAGVPDLRTGNLLPVPFLILFAKKILEFLSTLPRIGGFFQKIIRRADQKAAEIGHYEKWGLFLFVAIPLPGTGAWTGSLVAAVLRMRIWQAFLVITVGVLVSGSSPAGSPTGCSPRWHNTIIYINGRRPPAFAEGLFRLERK